MRRVRSHKLFEWSMNPLLPLTSITLTAKMTSCSFSGDFELLATDFASSLGAEMGAYLQEAPPLVMSIVDIGVKSHLNVGRISFLACFLLARVSMATLSASHMCLIALAQERHSLPAFLSAVTLRLFANRLEETLQGLATPPTLQ